MTQKNNSTADEAANNTQKAMPIPLDGLDEKEIALLAEHLTYLKLPAMAAHYVMVK